MLICPHDTSHFPHRTYIPNLISNASLYREQISGARLTGDAALTFMWTNNQCSHGEGEVWDTHRVLWVVDVAVAAQAVTKTEWSKEKNKSVNIS